MDNMEPKKLALLRILQILQRYSDEEHPLTQEDIAGHLEQEYGIVIERKAVGRNVSLLREAGFEIVSSRAGSYLDERLFENSEIRLLIDSVLCSRFITARHSRDLVEKLGRLSNVYFKSHEKNIFSVDKRGKTANAALFYNISLVNSAIEKKCCLRYDYNKYGADGKLHKSSEWVTSPYQLLLHNQRYYLMCFSERWQNMAFQRLDHITNMKLLEDTPATELRSVPGYRNGIDYKRLSLSMPYMYTDEPEPVIFSADESILDQIADWFGDEARLTPAGEGKILARVTVSPMAMKYWALQYADHVEVLAPASLREALRESLSAATEKYAGGSR